VLDGIDLEVFEGTIFSLLGPNGPARPPRFSAVDNLLTGAENLILMADLHHLGRREGRRRAADLLTRFDLVDAAKKTAATYSGGMRRRVYIFGGALGAGIGGASNGTEYINYLAPGVFLMTASSATASTAVAVCTDMTEGIVARFRTMAISRTSILTGHVVGSMIQTVVSIGVVISVALLIGFRPTTDPVRWIAAIGLLALLTLALTWLAVALGLVSKNPEGREQCRAPAHHPALHRQWVRPDRLHGGWVRWFAEYQPFTPIIESLRGLLMGAPIGDNAVIAVAWCIGIALAGYLWAKALFKRDPGR
jgi:ABC-2 type transport system permease protein